ncbi:cation:proton antiporter [Geodermatophilus obscurus]|uniref:Sodium/hydrogen exchanger n=1 Tax=Geodermatophilus obscurus (strain ATCC 25078 / DSM 43160 / JCM 3152 / CCUG 61914 / KCC A-0152 / KCTC 9177 / NBRC 13315 / NRRL B-3577 / G-20) TaxID=526225 RepID=D2SG37_GEOOG|nr:cation:proton antiporter [Geodermatophilus obscurus]ADB76905.1 sodium/hydrogen exchanger [Geodermatophilus obscurus DSM 43160]
MLLAGGLVALVVAALSDRIRRLPISEPLLGLLAGIVLGPAVAGLLDVRPLTEDHAWLHTATRILLAISVMAVALRYPLGAVRAQVRPVVLLLAIAMPLMAVITAGLSAWVLGVGVGAAVLQGAALCPTDPVLASSVVTGGPAEEDLPARDRQVLSLESGANDGLALPLVLAAVAIAGPLTAGEAALESLWQVAGAVVVGLATGWLGGRALRAGEAHGSTDPGPLALFTAVLALTVLGLSGLIHVDGVLAVFVCGLAFNGVSTGSERAADVPIDEAVNRFLVLPLFIGVGAALPWADWADLGWRGLLLAGAVLLLRRLPVLLALRRPLRLGWPDALYLGWFGPIGVSALFYLAMEAERLGAEPTVLAAGSLVVVASVVFHGATAAPGRATYRSVTRHGDQAETSATPGRADRRG